MTFPDAIGFDVETWGELPEYALQPFRALSGHAGVRAASFARDDKAAGSIDPSVATIRSVLTKAAEQGLYVVGWNVDFDAAWCVALGLEAEVFAVKWLDAMRLWRHADVEPEDPDTPANKRRSYSLEAALKAFHPDEADFKEFTDFQATDAASLKQLLHRNKMDALFTLRLAERFWAMLNPAQRQAALIEARCIPQVARTHVYGLKASRQAALDLKKALDAQVEQTHAALIEGSPEVDGVNLGSPKQLQTLLYETWGLTADRFSKKTNDPSTDKYALFDLAILDPRARMLKELREGKNNRVKYAEGTLKSLDYNGDGFVRPRARIFSTYTSRMTYSSSDKAVRLIEKTYKRKPSEMVEKKVEIPVGIALHQWKRGKEYRRLIEPPEGYDLVELDFAGQEFGWMAVASKDETMLELRAPGEDAHSFMGAQIAEIEYRELIRLVKDGDEHAALQRKLGKFCVAEGELVLTDRGLVPIEKVSLADRVWDGVEWVNHAGVVYQGEKEVVTYAGLTLTPDHRVYLEDGDFVCFGQAAAQNRRLARTANGWMPLRVVHDHVDRFEEGRADAETRLSMRLRPAPVGNEGQPDLREVDAVQGVCDPSAAREAGPRHHQRSSDAAPSEEMQCYEAAVREPKGSILQELRQAWDSISIWVGCRSHKLHLKRASSPDVPQGGYRPQGQRRALHSWEPPAGNTCNQPAKQAHQQDCSISRSRGAESPCVSCAAVCVARDPLLRSRRSEHGEHGPDIGGNTREVYDLAKLQTKRVYDVTCAGPRHRYTVRNYLISNSNLSFQYRVSAKTATTKARVDYELEVEEYFIKQILATYKASYPGVPAYWNSQIYNCARLGYAETFAGRRVQLKKAWAGREKWQMESTAINYPIQGCLQAGSRVRTLEGLKPIKDLVGRYVMAWTGFRWAPAIGVARGKCRLATIELESGHIVRCDTRHKLKNEAKAWVDFKDLQVGDYVALPRQTQAVSDPTEVNWDFVLGYYLGDGWVTEKRRAGKTWKSRTVGFCGGASKSQTLLQIKSFLEDEGFKTKLRKTKPTVWAVESHRKDLCEKMMSFGIHPNLTSRTKQLPDYLWTAAPDQVKAFWQGVCASDGAKGRWQEGNLHTSNLRLLRELQILIDSIGVPSTISETGNGWLLRILRHDGGVYPKHALLRDLKGFTPPCKAGDCTSIVDRRAVTGAQEVTQRVAERIYDKWLPEEEIYRYSKIVSIEASEVEAETYTLAVDDSLHQFVADGVIHKNTGGDQKYLALAVARNHLPTFGGHFYYELHDGLFFIFPKDKTAKATAFFKHALSNLPYKAAWGVTLPIDFPVDAKIGPSWGELKDFR